MGRFLEAWWGGYGKGRQEGGRRERRGRERQRVGTFPGRKGRPLGEGGEADYS